MINGFKTFKLWWKHCKFKSKMEIPDELIPKRFRNEKKDYQLLFTKRDRKNIFSLPVKDLAELKKMKNPVPTDSREMLERKDNKCPDCTRIKKGEEQKNFVTMKFRGIIKEEIKGIIKRFKTYKCEFSYKRNGRMVHSGCGRWVKVLIPNKQILKEAI